MIHTVIISTVNTGQVRRYPAFSYDEARLIAQRFKVCGVRHRGHRVEIVRRSVDEMGESELRAMLAYLKASPPDVA